jgi:hypothetical protein
MYLLEQDHHAPDIDSSQTDSSVFVAFSSSKWPIKISEILRRRSGSFVDKTKSGGSD